MEQELESLFTLKGKILIFIRDNQYRNPPLTAEDIQKQFKIGRSTASEYLSDLEKMGLITRKQNGRGKDIHLTSNFSL